MAKRGGSAEGWSAQTYVQKILKKNGVQIPSTSGESSGSGGTPTNTASNPPPTSGDNNGQG